MNTHITKELAVWLKERGCELPCTHYWENKIMGYTEMDFKRAHFSKNVSVLKREDECYMHAVPSYYQDIPAYTYYDILVTHAKEFWGDTVICSGCKADNEHSCTCPRDNLGCPEEISLYHSKVVLEPK